MGAASASGHGHLGRGQRGAGYVAAHRAIYEDVNGPIDSSLEVCHKCDNGGCCNPAHLFVGTHRENMLDMARKGRQPNRKLSWVTVREMRSLAATTRLTLTEIGTRYGVSRVQVRNILSNRQWVEYGHTQ